MSVDPRLLTQARSALWADAVLNEQAFSGAWSRAAVAAEYSQIELRNPSTSNRHVYVVHITSNNLTGNGNLLFGAYSGTALTSQLNTVGTTSLGSGKSPVSQLRSATNAAASLTGVNLGIARSTTTIAYNAIIAPNIPIKILPGYSLMLELDTVNQGFNGTIWWVERPVTL